MLAHTPADAAEEIYTLLAAVEMEFARIGAEDF